METIVPHPIHKLGPEAQSPDTFEEGSGNYTTSIYCKSYSWLFSKSSGAFYQGNGDLVVKEASIPF